MKNRCDCNNCGIILILVRIHKALKLWNILYIADKYIQLQKPKFKLYYIINILFNRGV